MTLQEEVQFSIFDYFCFTIVFIVSLSIGIYYAFQAKRHGSNMEDYLLGGRNMKLLPVSFSIVSSAISGGEIVGHITEIYAYGMHMWMFMVFAVARIVSIQFIFLPVFYELQLMSSFTYLEHRFDKTVKVIASTMYLIGGLIYIPVTIYVPALVFQKVTGLNHYGIAATLMILCVSYTAIGGIKAVVWTDMFQLVLIVGSVVVIMSVGLYNVGGIGNVWHALDRGGRLNFFKFDLDLEVRGTFWAYAFSLIFLSIYHMGLSQSHVQRYTSLPTLQKAKYALWIQCGVYILIFAMDLVIGGVMYTTYETCDPFSSGSVRKIDQTLPYFVQEKASLFPGFNGIFIAGIFAAGLSTTSTYLNTMSGTIYNDFLASKLKNASEERISNILKMIVMILGILGTLQIFVLEKMGTIFTMTFQISTITQIPMFGLFILGILFPKANKKGVKYGVIVCVLALATLIIGAFGKSQDPFLPMRTDGCLRNESFDLHQTTNSSILSQNSDIPWIFRINFQFYPIIGLILIISIGYLFSILTGGEEVQDQRLLATFLRKKIRQDPLLSDKEETTTGF